MTGESEDKSDEIFRIFKELSRLPIRGSNEENVKMRIVIPFLKALGYSDQGLDLEHNYSTGRPDIIVNDPSFPLVVEVKGTNEDLNRHITQIQSYSYTFSPYLAILTNGNYFYIFSPFWRRVAFENKTVLSFTLEDLDKQNVAEKIKLLLSVSEGDKRLEYLESLEKEIQRNCNQVDKLKDQISSLEKKKNCIEEIYPGGIEELKRLYDHLGTKAREDIDRHREITEQIEDLKAEIRLTQQQIPSPIGSLGSEKGRPDIVRPILQPITASNENFSMGIADEVINIRALQQGKQIVLCKTRRRHNNYVFIISKNNFDSDYQPSEFGRELEYLPINSNICSYVAKLEYLTIPGRNRKFWEELYKMGEFNLWKIDEGPFRYFEGVSPNRMLFWIIRVYKMPFEIREGEDFTPHHMLNSRIINDSTLRRIQQGFSNGNFEPVISDDQFKKRVEAITQTKNKYI